jgi:hypothetical protein
MTPISAAAVPASPHASWANTADRTARTPCGTNGLLNRFERQVDPDGVLPEDVRAMMVRVRTPVAGAGRQPSYQGSLNLLYRYIAQGRVEGDRPPISPRRLARLVLTRPNNLSDKQLRLRDELTAACPR